MAKAASTVAAANAQFDMGVRDAGAASINTVLKPKGFSGADFCRGLLFGESVFMQAGRIGPQIAGYKSNFSVE